MRVLTQLPLNKKYVCGKNRGSKVPKHDCAGLLFFVMEEEGPALLLLSKLRSILSPTKTHTPKNLVSMPSSHLPILYLLVAWVHCLPGNNHSANSTLHHDYCVLGAGPAGLQMGYFLSKSQRDYIILERNSGPGSFFNIYPRHRKLISINKIYTGRRNREFNLRHDWNSLLSDRPDLLLQRISTQMYPEADALPRYLSLYARELGLKVQYGVDIGRVSALNLRAPGGRSYTLIDQKGTEYSCRVLLVSTGLWVPQQVHFVGSDLVEGYETAPVDPEQYRNQAVLILGKGNSAFETAQNILGRASSVHLYSRNPVRLAWQTHYVGDLRMFSPPVQMAVLRDRRVKMSGSWPDMFLENLHDNLHPPRQTGCCTDGTGLQQRLGIPD